MGLGFRRVATGLTAPLPWQVMKTMARKCTRARYYSPEMMREEYVRSAYECVDWGETEEVSTLFYIAKDMVQGRRAADELMLDWDDVKKVDATESTTGGMVRPKHPSNHATCRVPVARRDRGGAGSTRRARRGRR